MANAYLSFGSRRGDSAWLDAVRALAIVLVLLRHGHRASGAAGDMGVLDAFLLNGWIGVDLFFVLSGYLISRHLIAHGLGTGRFRFGRYVVMRALRIVPAYLAVMVLIVLGFFPLYEVDRADLGARVAYHVLFLQDYLPANINVVFWSLGVEEKFYLVAPLLIWIALTRRSARAGVLVLLALAAAAPALRAATYALQPAPLSYEAFFVLLRSPFHECLEPLLAGTAIAVALHARAPQLSPGSARRLLVLAGVLLGGWLFSHEFLGTIGWFDVIAQPVITAFLCGLLVLGAVMMRDAPVPCQGGVRCIARLSYALYLVHYPLVPFALAAANGTAFRVAAFWSVYLFASFALAVLLHFTLEKPFLVLKDALRARDFPRSRADLVTGVTARGAR